MKRQRHVIVLTGLSVVAVGFIAAIVAIATQYHPSHSRAGAVPAVLPGVAVSRVIACGQDSSTQQTVCVVQYQGACAAILFDGSTWKPAQMQPVSPRACKQ